MHDRLLTNKIGAFWSVMDAAMADAFGDTSPSSAAAILTLHFHAPLTGTGLSRILRLSQPATVRLLDRLVDAGAVARAGRKDGREVGLALTASGKARARALLKARDNALAALLTPLAPDKRAQLAELLDEVLPEAVGNRNDARFLCRFCNHGVCDGPACPIGCRATEIEERTKGKPA